MIKKILISVLTLGTVSHGTYASQILTSTQSSKSSAILESCLCKEVYNDHLRAVKFLLEKGVDPNCRNEDGFTPYEIAYKSCFIESACHLLKYGAKKVDVETVPYLAWAAAFFEKEELIACIENDSCTRSKIPALHAAVLANRPAIIALLLSYGADFFELDENKKSPLDLAESLGHEEIVQLLRDHEERLSKLQALYSAFDENDMVRAKALLKGIDLTLPDAEGNLPLSVAAKKGSIEAVQLLLDHGADIDAIDPFVKNHIFRGGALHHAACEGDIAMARYLLEHNAAINLPTKRVSILFWQDFMLGNFGDFNIESTTHSTPLAVTTLSVHGTVELVSLFLNNTSPLISESMPSKSLINAVLTGRAAMVRALLEHADSLTPDLASDLVKLALDFGRREVIELLYTYGAPLEEELTEQEGKPRGIVMLHVAVDQGNLKLVNFLLEQQVDWTCRTEYGDTVCHVFFENENSKILNPGIIELVLEKATKVTVKDYLRESLESYERVKCALMTFKRICPKLPKNVMAFIFSLEDSIIEDVIKTCLMPTKQQKRECYDDTYLQGRLQTCPLPIAVTIEFLKNRCLSKLRLFLLAKDSDGMRAQEYVTARNHPDFAQRLDPEMVNEQYEELTYTNIKALMKRNSPAQEEFSG